VHSTISTHIESLAYHGSGVAHLPDGRTVFVDNAAPGDHVLIELFESHTRYARARICEILEASPQRIRPLCIHHEVCGGCPWQHLTYEVQYYWKQQFVIEALRRIGMIQVPERLVEATVPSSKAWEYRNKIELEAQIIDRSVKLGFHKKKTGEFTTIDSCKLLPRRYLEVPQKLTGAMAYACREMAPDLLRVNVRVSEITNDVEISLWTKPCGLARSLTMKVLNNALLTTSMTRIIVDGATKERKVKHVEVLAGRGYWRESLDERILKLSSPSFFQVNTPGAEILVKTVLEFLRRVGIGKHDHVADLYAGAGTLTLPLAARFTKVSAIESYGPSIRDLRRNLEEYGLEAQVIGGDVARELEGIGSISAAIIDPPRSGLSVEARAALITAQPNCIVYISCNPATLARDIRYLNENEYRLLVVRPIDLFPQTYHIESVALLVHTGYLKARD